MRLTICLVLAILFHIFMLKAFGRFIEHSETKNIFQKNRNINIRLSYLSPSPKTLDKDDKNIIETPPKKIERDKAKKSKADKKIRKKENLPKKETHNQKNHKEVKEISSNILDKPNDKNFVKHETIKASPIYKKNPSPEYPKTAKKRGYQGIVLLDVLVNANGRVKDIKIAASSGYEILDKEALKTVRKWLFIPGKENDKNIEMWVEVPVRFILR